MDRNQAKEFYPILQAFAEGRVIECRTKPSLIEGSDVPNDWTEMKEIRFWNNIEYRIKQEPKYRPFKNAEECWQEMQKHQPFGWVKRNGYYYNIVSTDITSVRIINNKGAIIIVSFSNLLSSYTFVDGTLFGIKDEE